MMAGVLWQVAGAVALAVFVVALLWLFLSIVERKWHWGRDEVDAALRYRTAAGRACPHRATAVRTHNGGEQVATCTTSDHGQPALVFERPYGWLDESLQRAKELAVALAFVAVVAFTAGVLSGYVRS